MSRSRAATLLARGGRTRRSVRTAGLVAVVGAALAVPASASSAASASSSAAPVAGSAARAAAAPVVAPRSRAAELARSPELTETTRLPDRRSLVVGDRFWQMGTADGQYPASGFHTRGEMGGFWTPPIKLLDGMWFSVDGSWLGPATATTTGYGYVRTSLPTRQGVRASRTDVAPDGVRAGLTALTFTADADRTIRLSVDAHSELMSAYPWATTNPSQKDANLRDTASVRGRTLQFRDVGTPPVPNAERHDWTALVGSTLRPAAAQTGRAFRGPQDPPVICPLADPGQPAAPPRCDDTAYGNGAGGRLTYRVRLRAGAPTTVWFGVAGSDRSPADARRQLRRVLDAPAATLARTVARQEAVGSRTRVSLPGDPLLQRSVEWSKQNLIDSVQQARDLRIRVVREGREYPPPSGTLARARWIGAGWPDYPWIFATDGEYSAFAAVAAGQFAPIKDHVRTLRLASRIANGGSGKIVHEVTPDGAVFFGANADAGNTDESAKFPSMVALVWRWTGDRAFLNSSYGAAVRAMRHVLSLDADHDGWPEGLGNVERPGMGEEKLDSTVYTIRGLHDLADLASARGDVRTRDWARGHEADLRRRFESAWWFGGDTFSYADSLKDPGDQKVFQRHWIGLTPVEAELAGGAGESRPVARQDHAVVTVQQHQRPCYTGDLGLFHTGTGPTSAPNGNPGATCDSTVSTVPSERSIFSLNTSIMAVAEGNVGRIGPTSQGRYTTSNARIQLDPSIWEMPGAMPEIAPSPDFGANIDKPLNERSSVLQAWGTYGVLWPVVHQQLGVDPDMGRRHVTVVPQVPTGQERVSGTGIRLGRGSVDVAASRTGTALRTDVVRRVRASLTVGVLLPAGTRRLSATLNGRPVTPVTVRSARGVQELVTVPAGTGRTSLVVRYGG
jgi:hypothetical protein